MATFRYVLVDVFTDTPLEGSGLGGFIAFFDQLDGLVAGFDYGAGKSSA